MRSAIYEGKVRHRRNFPKLHQFDFKLFMLWIDLDEVGEIFRGSWFWSASRFTLARFQANDYLKAYQDAESETPDSLRHRVTSVLQENEIDQVPHRIRLLTQVRYLGYSMNPISLFYCYDSDEQLSAIIAEVNNTPWGEQHVYVLPKQAAPEKQTPTADPPARHQQPIRASRIEKSFHVSPFMSMDMFYRMAMTVPDSNLVVKIENHITEDHHEIDRNEKSSDRILDVVMKLERKELSLARLNWMLIKYPLLSFRVFAGIYWQALRLYLKRIRFYPHGSKTEPADDQIGQDKLTPQTTLTIQ